MSSFNQRKSTGAKNRSSIVTCPVPHLCGGFPRSVTWWESMMNTLWYWSITRVNISNALVMGLPKDLHIVGMKTNIALTIFFVPYIVFEIPSNILMKRFKPHVWRELWSTGKHVRRKELTFSSIGMHTGVWDYHVVSRLWCVVLELDHVRLLNK